MTPCFNEEANIQDVYSAVKNLFQGELKNYLYEHVFIDNCSNDKTVEILKKIAQDDKRVKIIVNIKNFGQNRSPYYGVLQCHGDAVIPLVADLQEPLSIIHKFVERWERGYKIVIGIKKSSAENKIMFGIRRVFYRLIESVSEIEHISNFTGFGLYDKEFIKLLKGIDDQNPYFRGLVSELGFERAEIEYTQARRRKGKTKNNFFSLYEVAILGFVNHSKLLLRLSSFIGFIVASLSILIAIGYFIYKLFFWEEFTIGIAPLVIGLFFFSSVQLFFIGIIGEYVGAIYTQTKKRPLVIEKERINFD
jgi:glycosyltransferase involved in cell wall biosynthesis